MGIEDLLAYADLPFAAALIVILWKIVSNHYQHLSKHADAQTKTLAEIAIGLSAHAESDALVFKEMIAQLQLQTMALSKLNDNIIRIEERTRRP